MLISERSLDLRTKRDRMISIGTLVSLSIGIHACGKFSEILLDAVFRRAGGIVVGHILRCIAYHSPVVRNYGYPVTYCKIQCRSLNFHKNRTLSREVLWHVH
jgi:hypothetical protein